MHVDLRCPTHIRSMPTLTSTLIIDPVDHLYCDPDVVWALGNVAEAFPGVSTSLGFTLIHDPVELAASGGVVTDLGGMLSHGAIVARETGIRAVIGTKNATRIIRDRQPIRLNGDPGLIELLD